MKHASHPAIVTRLKRERRAWLLTGGSKEQAAALTATIERLTTPRQKVA